MKLRRNDHYRYSRVACHAYCRFDVFGYEERSRLIALQIFRYCRAWTAAPFLLECEKGDFVSGVIFSVSGKYKKADCIELLRKKYSELGSRGESRYPKRADFSDEEVTAIKAFLGPWPRALEKAGVKPVKKV